MTRRQQTAFDNPCVVAEQCVDRQFQAAEYRKTTSARILMVSSILTFNFGME